MLVIICVFLYANNFGLWLVFVVVQFSLNICTGRLLLYLVRFENLVYCLFFSEEWLFGSYAKFKIVFDCILETLLPQSISWQLLQTYISFWFNGDEAKLAIHHQLSNWWNSNCRGIIVQRQFKTILGSFSLSSSSENKWSSS